MVFIAAAVWRLQDAQWQIVHDVHLNGAFKAWQATHSLANDSLTRQ